MSPGVAQLIGELSLAGGDSYPGKYLAFRLGVRERDVRRLVLAARKEGHRIVASERGYRLVSDPDEAEQAARTIMRHGACELATGRMYLRWARELRGNRIRQEHQACLDF